MFEDTKRGDQKAKSKKSKQYNGQKKKRGGGDKQWATLRYNYILLII